MRWDEESWGIIILWVALCIYIAAGIKFQNFVYALIFNYAIFWIWQKRTAAESRIKTNIVIISVIHILIVIGNAVYFFKEGKGYFYSGKAGAEGKEKVLPKFEENYA